MSSVTNKLSDAVDGVVNFSLDRVPPTIFDKVKRNKAFTNEDCLMMAEILGLRKKPSNKKRKRTVQYIAAPLVSLANENDERRTIAQHQLIQERYRLEVEQNFFNNDQFRKSEIARENEQIDTSEFDKDSYIVLHLINQIIKSTDKKRDEASKRSTNQIVRGVQ